MKKLFLLILLPTLLFSCTSKKDSNTLVYIGTDNPNPANGINYCYFNSETGEISECKIAAKIKSPNFLYPDTKNNYLFCVGATPTKDNKYTSALVCYKINQENNSLDFVSQSPVFGNGPCFVEYNVINSKILTANYSSGNVVSYNFTDGTINYEGSYQHYGNGPNKARQKKPHAHSIRVAPDNKYAYAADLGTDKIMVYKLINSGLQLQDSITSTPGAGPRHIDFSPSGNTMAVVNELNSTVTTYTKDENNIYKNEITTLKMLPDTFSGFSKAADIHFSPDEKFLYASNRGFNSIAIYKVIGSKLEFIDWQSEGINWPRNFAISPNGNFMLVANRDSNEITVFKINRITGKLIKLNYSTKVEKPICVRFFAK